MATIEWQRPERGTRGHAVAPAGQCCCCCCCCLHSVGSLIGAASALSRPPQGDTIPAAAIDGPTREPKYSAASLYWMLVLLLSGLAIAWNLGIERHPDSGEAVLIIAIVLPAVQIAASIVAAMILVFSNRPGHDHRLRHLGRITLRAFLGALIGALVMLPMFKC